MLQGTAHRDMSNTGTNSRPNEETCAISFMSVNRHQQLQETDMHFPVHSKLDVNN